jgi:threonine dehydrogenase-like Zn-dependent dehydrogenase
LKALTVLPRKAGSLEVTDVPDPEPGDGELLVDGLAVGVCGTDKEIAAGDYGWAPHGHDRLVIGHESLGRVRQAPDGSGFAAGDLVVGVVRRPDPEPCGACAHGHFDMCRNGRYTERGIKEIDGYASEAWTVEAHYAVKLDPGLAELGVLLELAPLIACERARLEHDRVGHAGHADVVQAARDAQQIRVKAQAIRQQRAVGAHALELRRDRHAAERFAFHAAPRQVVRSGMVAR